jgi:hypothetical protein
MISQNIKQSFHMIQHLWTDKYPRDMRYQDKNMYAAGHENIIYNIKKYKFNNK